MRSLIAAAGLLFSLTATSALALSEADYVVYMKESPAFARAEKRLNAAWKKLKAELPKAVFQDMQIEQRAWLQDRDPAVEAARRAGDTRPPAEIYAETTLQRALILEAKLGAKPQGRTEAPQTPAETPGAQSQSLAGKYGGGAISLAPEGDGWSVVVNTVGPNGRWVCDYVWRARQSGDILTFEEKGGGTPIRVYVRGDTLTISPDLNPGVSLSKFCGSGGDFFGEYTKDR